MPGLELVAAPLRCAPQQVACLLAGIALFGLGRRLKPRTGQRLWLACGLLYLTVAAATISRAASDEDDRPRAAEFETALGLSFLGASLASEKLERLKSRPSRP